jgi:hypothetical protein
MKEPQTDGATLPLFLVNANEFLIQLHFAASYKTIIRLMNIV